MKMGTLQKGITNEKKWNKRVQTKNKKQKKTSWYETLQKGTKFVITFHDLVKI